MNHSDQIFSAALGASIVAVFIVLILAVFFSRVRISDLIDCTRVWFNENWRLNAEKLVMSKKIVELQIRHETDQRSFELITELFANKMIEFKKLETVNKQLRTKIRNANLELINYNDDHFRNKRKAK